MSETITTIGKELANLRNGRRGLFIFLPIALTALGSALFWVNSRQTWVDGLLWVLLTLLLAHLALGFSLALLGFFREVGGKTDMDEAILEDIDTASLPATAVLIPVFNEDMATVSRRLRAMWQSLEKTGHQDAFDFYLLSDSNDPNFWATELETWMQLVSELGASKRLFYRRRKNQIGHKSGNIADFCRRWGKHYRYMLVLDADSILSGDLMVKLATLMEKRPNAGIIQTVPQLIRGENLYQRTVQFAASLYGRIIIQGCTYWQMDAANYWGHNAIIRISAFMKHCALPELPSTDSKRDQILSHDTVEAALMRKAGYEVWLLPNLSGSYEEVPPNLTESLARDRRWCRGNFQHVWFLFAKGLDFSNRIHIAMGLMVYGCSPLWLLFLIVGIVSIGVREAFPFAPNEGDSPLPLLFYYTLALLIVPKFLAAFSARPRWKTYGGLKCLLAGVLTETLLFTLLAPIIMLFHTLFVFQALVGIKTGWGGQNRSETDLSWEACIKTYGWVSLLGIGVTAALWFLLPSCIPWLSPILFSWIFAVPLVRWTSLSGLGIKAREWGVFLTPEEVEPVDVITRSEGDGVSTPTEMTAISGFERLILDPLLASLHVSFLRQQEKSDLEMTQRETQLIESCMERGSNSLESKEKQALLNHSQAVLALHERLWTTPESFMVNGWRNAFGRIHFNRSARGRFINQQSDST